MKENQRLEQELARRSEEVGRLKRELIFSNEKCISLCQENKALRETNSNLNKQINDKEIELRRREIQKCREQNKELA